MPTVDECERIAFKAGVEAAAKWHDDLGADDTPHGARGHAWYASQIRALAPAEPRTGGVERKWAEVRYGAIKTRRAGDLTSMCDHLGWGVGMQSCPVCAMTLDEKMYETCGTCGKTKGRSVCPDCLDCELWWKENPPPEDV